MTRLFLLCLAIAAIAFVTVWVADHPGKVALNWEAYRIETSVAVLVGAAALAAAMSVTVFEGVRMIWHGPAGFRAARRRRREQRGYRALTLGLVAAAAGDARGARRLARRADSLLSEPPLTLLLSAQAAQLEGDERAAKGYFEAMLARPETEFLGLRGLLVDATKTGDRALALELVQKAYRLRPHTPWVLTTLLELQMRANKWIDAEATLQAALKHRVLDRALGTRRRALVMLGRAQTAKAAGNPADARRFAGRAREFAADLVPAAALAAELEIEAGQLGRAQKILGEAWETTPHPELGALLLDAVEDSTPAERAGHVKRGVAHNPDHVESHLLLARVSLDAQLWGQARRHLDAAAAARSTAGIFRLMADLEEGDTGDREAGRHWLLEASRAAPDPVWVCAECAAPAAAWAMHCPACGAFDRFEWRSPPAPRVAVAPASDAIGPDLSPKPEAASKKPPSRRAKEKGGETPAERAARMT